MASLTQASFLDIGNFVVPKSYFLELLGEVIVTHWISLAVSWKQARDLEKRTGGRPLVPALISEVKVSGLPSRSTVTRWGLGKTPEGGPVGSQTLSGTCSRPLSEACMTQPIFLPS